MPLSPIQMAAGLTPMPILNFIMAAFVGGLIRASIFSYFGNALTELSWVSATYSAAIFLAALAIPLAFPAGRAWLFEAFTSPQREENSTDA